ncbi:hypothetical protein [Streptomyces sp. NPDC001100]
MTLQSLVGLRCAGRSLAWTIRTWPRRRGIATRYDRPPSPTRQLAPHRDLRFRLRSIPQFSNGA